MEEVRLKRRGALFKDEEGGLLLVNDDNQAFKVDEVVAYIWSICDGKTVNEVVMEFAKVSNVEADEVRQPLMTLLEKLRSVSLIE
ncbi:MAG: PqqD family protein [Candidatus Wolframiiraptor sp. EX4484-121]|nr:MAG: PqqD family protein [Candidatus Wolframiiraptor sp. EX4484-121]